MQSGRWAGNQGHLGWCVILARLKGLFRGGDESERSLSGVDRSKSAPFRAGCSKLVTVDWTRDTHSRVGQTKRDANPQHPVTFIPNLFRESGSRRLSSRIADRHCEMFDGQNLQLIL